MKHSDIYSKSGIIYNEVIDIAAQSLKGGIDNVLVTCNDNEIFDEAIKTLRNRYPQIIGISDPNPGVKLVKRKVSVSILDDNSGHILHMDIMTKEEYEADKTNIDKVSYNLKKHIMWTGGEN